MTNRITEELLMAGESSTVEFKTSKVPVVQVARVVCGFLNTKGGVLVVGVDDSGVPDKGVREQQADELADYLRGKISPAVLYDVTLDEIGNGKVICIGVPAGPDPPYVFSGSVYIRRGARTRTADASELRALVEEANRDALRWERRPCIGLEINQIDRKLLNETTRRAQDRRGYVFREVKDAALTLAELSLIQSGQLTNAADVLFGKVVARHHPQTRLRAVCYATDKADDFVDEQLFEGPAFGLLEEAMAFLKRHVPIAAEFSGDQLARQSKPKYPFDALREGLVNALVHRDYAAFSGSVSVSVYTDRVEIWNSGSLPHGLSPRDLVLPSHASVLVNPDIGHVFYLHELMERVGRGTYKIARQCMDFGMRQPVWKHTGKGVRLTLFAAVPGKTPIDGLNSRQRNLLDSLPAGEQIRVPEYVERFGEGITDRQARRDLVQLEAMGLVRRIGSGSKTTYERMEVEP